MTSRTDIDPALPKALRRIYTEIPAAECKGLCWAACTRVPCSPAELEQAQRVGGNPPQASTLCRFLGPDKLCTIYAARPLVCRLYGVSRDPRLTCPHGCRATLSVAKSAELVRRSVEVSPGVRSLDMEVDGLLMVGNGKEE